MENSQQDRATKIEDTICDLAERALGVYRDPFDNDERMALYCELKTLCQIGHLEDSGLSEEARKKLARIEEEAHAVIRRNHRR